MNPAATPFEILCVKGGMITRGKEGRDRCLQRPPNRILVVLANHLNCHTGILALGNVVCSNSAVSGHPPN